MRLLSLLALSTVILITSGCASLSKEECLSGNWQQIGYDDGTKGRDASSNLRSHTKSCGEHGVRVNGDAYFAGHQNGLKKYCAAANGRRLGEQGLHYAGICPTELEQAFLVQYNYGKAIYTATREYNNTRTDINNKEEQLKKEPDARIRESLRNEISTLDKLLRSQQNVLDQLTSHPPR